jgi:hypothetical protein
MKKLGEKIFKFYLCLVGGWVIFALCFQCFFLYLHFSNQEERASRIVREIDWKIDGTFKDDPNNIWYDGPKK